MVKKKRKSKRITLHHKYKVEKKVREHHRNLRREAKKNPNKKKLKKDPGIPNLYPYKSELLQKLEIQREKLKDQEKKQKENRFKEITRRRNQESASLSVDSFSKEAFQRAQEFESSNKNKSESVLQSENRIDDSSKKSYYHEFKKVLESSDVLLEVLDARDPLGCRCYDIEKHILAKYPSKKIILILNKIDLVPKENILQWLSFLRNEFPTVVFKCSTQQQRRHLKSSIKTLHQHLQSGSIEMIEKSSECLGAETLLQLLKNYCRNLDIKTSISVGIIGYPNVGKSSLINSLKRSKSVGVGATPGFTKVSQEVYLDKNIKLLDCPGIIFSGENFTGDVLRNCVKVEQITDPISPVETILKRCNKSQLMQTYKIANFENEIDFLTLIAHKRGKLKKGGVADLPSAARAVLYDWNSGKISFYTTPPLRSNFEESHLSAAIVPQWGKEFNIQQVIEQERDHVIVNLADQSTRDYMELTVVESKPTYTISSELLSCLYNNEHPKVDGDVIPQFSAAASSSLKSDTDSNIHFMDPMHGKAVPMEDTEPNSKLVNVMKGNHKRVNDLTDMEDQFNPQINRLRKKAQKNMKKLRRKASSSVNSDLNSEGYDFSTDFFSVDK